MLYTFNIIARKRKGEGSRLQSFEKRGEIDGKKKKKEKKIANFAIEQERDWAPRSNEKCFSRWKDSCEQDNLLDINLWLSVLTTIGHNHGRFK